MRVLNRHVAIAVWVGLVYESLRYIFPTIFFENQKNKTFKKGKKNMPRKLNFHYPQAPIMVPEQKAPTAAGADLAAAQASAAAACLPLSIDAQSSFMRERAAQRASEIQNQNVCPPLYLSSPFHYLSIPICLGPLTWQYQNKKILLPLYVSRSTTRDHPCV